MPIEREFEKQGGGNYVTEPGDYRVTIIKAEARLSKKGKPMLELSFETDNHKAISGYYLKDTAWSIKPLVKIKTICGLDPKTSATELVGKRLGIAVAPGNQREDGSFFMRIVGYGPESEVSAMSDFAQNPDDLSNIPF